MTVTLHQQTFIAADWGEAIVSNGTATVDTQFSFGVEITGTLAQGNTINLLELNPSHTSINLICSGLGSIDGFVLVDGDGNDFLFSNIALAIGSQQVATTAGLQAYSTTAPCFAAGTRIATEHGEVVVEALRVGMRVFTVLGHGLAPVIWIGWRSVDCARHPNPERVWPVRVRAGAFGPLRPRCDLYISPDHGIYVNEVLIPAKYLVNGTSIAQVQMNTVTYYHIELAVHDIVLAEGLPTESYLETGDRANFVNGGSVVRQFPDSSARAWEALGCAPLIVTGKELQAARLLVNRCAAPQAAVTLGVVALERSIGDPPVPRMIAGPEQTSEMTMCAEPVTGGGRGG